MDYKQDSDPTEPLRSTLIQVRSILSIDAIAQIDFKHLENNLLYLSSFSFQGNELQTIYSSGILPKMNFFMLQLPQEMQIAVLIFFKNMVESNELFSLLLLESGLFLNIPILWIQLRHNTAQLLIQLAKHKLAAQRIILFLQDFHFDDINLFSDEAKNATIELLFSLLTMDPFGSEHLFCHSISQILTSDPSLKSDIFFKVIEVGQEIEICDELYQWFESEEIKPLWFEEQNDNYCKIYEWMINIALGKANEDDAIGLIDLIQDTFVLFTINQKELILDFFMRFNLYQIDNFVSFFASECEDITDLMNGPDICLSYSKMILCNPDPKNYLNHFDELLQTIYSAIYAKNHYDGLIPKLIPLELVLRSFIEAPNDPSNDLIILKMITFSEDRSLDFTTLFQQAEEMTAFLADFNKENDHDQEIEIFKNTMKETFGLDLNSG